MNWFTRTARAVLYIINILWSAYLIWNSYQQTTDVSTALLTVIILLGAMILNDMMKK